MTCFSLLVRWLLLTLLLPLSSCQEKDPWAGDSSIPTTISFNQHIRPLLARECLSCHGEENPMAGLSLHLPSGVASVTSDNSPKKSLLWEKIASHHPVALPKREKAILWRWIKQGTPTESHWAALPLSNPSPGSLPPALPGNAPVDQQEFSFLAHTLFGRAPTPTELSYNSQHQPSRSLLIDSMLQQTSFAEFFKNRLILLSGARPVPTEGPFAPYLRWLDTEIANPDFALDDFFRNSLAGDLLPDGGQQSTIATAWTRLPHRSNLHSLSQRVAQSLLAIDLTESSGSNDLWPSASDTLPAFLPNFPPAAQGSIATPPFLALNTPQQIAALQSAEQDEPQHWQIAKSPPANATVNFAQWLAQEEPSVGILDLATAFSFDEANPKDLAPTPIALISAPAGPLTLSQGVQGTALAPPADFKGLPLASDRAFTLSFFLKLSHLQEDESPLFFARTAAGAPVGFRLNISSKSLTIALLNGSTANSLAAKGQTIPQPGQWHHLAIGYDGSRTASGLKLWIDAQAIPLTTINDSLYGTARAPDNQLHYRYPLPANSAPTLLDEFQIYRSLLSEIEIAHLRDGRALLKEVRNEFPREDLLFNYYLRNKSATARHQLTQAIKTSHTVSTLQDTSLLVPVAGPTPRPQIRPTLPFNSLPMDAEPNRLGFANWLLAPQNPVTPRVLASRLYEMVHGVTLLPSGNISDPWQVPAEPALLDFLARDILQSQWNLRDILHTILLYPPRETSPHQGKETAI